MLLVKVFLVLLKTVPCFKVKLRIWANPTVAQWVLTQCPLFICLPLRSLNRLHCQQAVLDKLGQRHYQQVQSGWQWVGSAGDSKEGVSQRHSSGRDGWVELVTSASDCHWGLVRGVWRDYVFNQLSGCRMELSSQLPQQLGVRLCEVAEALDN